MSQSIAPESPRNRSSFSFLVRVERGTEKESGFCGTGFLISPRHVLTCAHVVSGPNPGDEEPGDILVRCAEQLTEFRRGALVGIWPPDAALIRLDEAVSVRPVELITNVRAEHERAIAEQHPIVVGFSESHPDTLVKSQITGILGSLGAVETGKLLEVQIEGGRAAGMSGSPVLVKVSGNWACLGMLYLGGERAGNSRFMLADSLLALVNKHLVDDVSRLDADDVLGPGADDARDEPGQVGKDYAERFIAYATSAGRVKATEQPIPLASVYVHRSRQEDRIRELFEINPARQKGMWVSIEGQAGAGKTSLLWYFYDSIRSNPKTIVQPFAAQDMSEDCSAERTLIAHYLARWNRRCVVLIDTLDLIVGRSDRHLRSFLSWLRMQRVFVVTTCRPLEARQFAAMECPDHVVPLGRYEEAEAKIAVRRYVEMAYEHLTETRRTSQQDDLWNLLDGRRKVQALTFDPLVLRMIFETYPPDPVPQEVNTALIYSAYWERRVIRDRLSHPDARGERLREAVACRLAYAILFRETDTFDDAIREVEFEEAWKTAETNLGSFPWSTFDELRSRGVIEPAGGVDRFRFFHQTLLEFAAARFLLRAPLAIQQACVERVLSDLARGLFIRSPILVQMATQDAHAGGHDWKHVLTLLFEIGSETACHLTLEIFGKVTDTDFCLQTLRQWKERHGSRLAECAVIAVSHYPKHRLGLGFSVLECVLDTEAAHDALGLCSDRLARIDPEGALEFLGRTSAFISDKSTDYNLRGHYKNALFVCFDSGHYDALSILASVFDHLSTGLRQNSLTSLAGKVSDQSAPAIAEFLQSIQPIVHGSDANAFIGFFLNLLISLNAVAPQLARQIANDIATGKQPERLDDHARLQGGIEGGILRNAETIPRALTNIVGQDHFERRAAAAMLAFSDPSDHERILDHFLSLDLPSLEKSVRTSLFDVAAAMSGAHPERLLAFVDACPYPENAAGRAWRKISSRLAVDSPETIRPWLLSRIDGDRSLSHMTAVGASQVLQVQPGIFTESEVLRIFDLALAAEVDSRRTLVECVGAIASERPSLASEIVAELIKPRHRDVWATLAYSLKGCLSKNLRWVCSCVPLFLETAESRSDDGMFAAILETLRDWPEDELGALIDLMEEKLTTETLSAFPQETCQVEYLMLVKYVGRHAPDRAYRLLTRAIVATTGSAGAAAMAVANIVGHTSDEAILADALDQMLAVAVQARQRNARNALHRGLRIIDEKLGSRRVIERFFALYASLQDDYALEVLVRIVCRLPSWSSTDSEALLRDATHIKGKVRSYMLKVAAG